MLNLGGISTNRAALSDMGAHGHEAHGAIEHLKCVIATEELK